MSSGGIGSDSVSSGAEDPYRSLASTFEGKRKAEMTAEERTNYERERNRVHARNTRARKKQYMEGLKERVENMHAQKVMEDVAMAVLSLSLLYGGGVDGFPWVKRGFHPLGRFLLFTSSRTLFTAGSTTVTVVCDSYMLMHLCWENEGAWDAVMGRMS